MLDAEFLALLDFWVGWGEGATLLSGSPRITVRYLSHLVLISSTTRAHKCIWWVQNGCILSTTKWGETLVWSSSSALLDVLRWCEELLFNCNATVEEEQSLWRSIKKKVFFEMFKAFFYISKINFRKKDIAGNFRKHIATLSPLICKIWFCQKNVSKTSCECKSSKTCFQRQSTEKPFVEKMQAFCLWVYIVRGRESFISSFLKWKPNIF